MKILIIEDEPQAAQRIEKLVLSLVPEGEIVGQADTVKKAVQWFRNNPAPDLTLMDIQLADGISFQIFEQCEVKSPIIFTTAYDEYALKAFKVNSVDYILKPVDKDELKAALGKLKGFTASTDQTRQMLDNISEAVNMLMKKHKSRFVIKVGEHLKTIDVSAIRYFFSQDKATFCVTDDQRNFVLDYTLEQLEEMIDPRNFFRINRKYLISASAIQDIIHYTNSRLRLVLRASQDNDIIVARERVQEFKDWLDR
jgi:DNA-binding LytR/AlgR family response regulator